jgi:predicted transposase YbfD/YdcC
MTIFTQFSEIQDPRVDRTQHYPLSSLFFLTIAAVVADCEDYTEIADFGEDRLDRFQSHGHFTDGRTPSHDVLTKLFRRLDPKEFQECFIRWTASLCEGTDGRLVAIDGKSLRRSHDAQSGKKPTHVINAWSSMNQVVLAQLKVDGKSNEITAIPELLALLDLKGAIVSIDAMGCQTDIAEKIVEHQGSYLLGLKGNQSGLLEEVEMLFVHNKPSSTHNNLDKGHGRIEERRCDVIDKPALLKPFAQWKDLRSIIRLWSKRQNSVGGEPTEEIRFYISSAKADAERFGTWIRQHWGVENQVHWMLDVIFDEDGSRIRKGHADQNMAIIRRTALNLCRLHHDPRKSISRKRMTAARRNDYLDSLLGFKRR